jgi:AcrR family transcriptional regulator
MEYAALSWIFMAGRRTSERCPRPYALGKRKEAADQNRARVLDAARDLLAKEGASEFSMDAVARQAGVTRQTIHNQFGTRSELVEALFDRMAMRGGMGEMAMAMQQPDPIRMLQQFIEVFGQFWSSDRVAIRRIHGLAALDPELGRIDHARNERRRMAANRVVDALSKRFGKPLPVDRSDAVALLFSITSFEFFDRLAGDRTPEQVCSFIVRVMLGALGISG